MKLLPLTTARRSRSCSSIDEPGAWTPATTRSLRVTVAIAMR